MNITEKENKIDIEIIEDSQIWGVEVFSVSLDLKKINGVYKGDVSIETLIGWRTWTGEHAANDFIDEFGFKIIEKQTK